jgi:hypothetical protein
MRFLDNHEIRIRNLRSDAVVEPYDIRVDRANKILGNPFVCHDDALREGVCEMYANIDKPTEYWEEIERLKDIYLKHNKLNLFCWCAPKQCHAEYIRDAILLAIKRDEDHKEGE